MIEYILTLTVINTVFLALLLTFIKRETKKDDDK